MTDHTEVLTDRDLEHLTWALENTDASPGRHMALKMLRYIQAQKSQLESLYASYDETQRVIRECLKEIDNRTPEEETPRLMFIRNMLLARLEKNTRLDR